MHLFLELMLNDINKQVEINMKFNLARFKSHRLLIATHYHGKIMEPMSHGGYQTTSSPLGSIVCVSHCDILHSYEKQA